jgi:hypothetical protein
VGVVGLLFALDYIVNLPLLLSYIHRMQGHGSPFNYPGGWNQPAPYFLFKDLLSGVSGGNMIPFLLVSGAYLVCILYATGKYYQKNNEDFLKIISLGMLSIFMVLPYMAPYDFVILTIPLYVLFKDCSYQMKFAVLTIISALPSFIWISPALGINDDSLPLLVGSYAQTYSLILIFLVAILHDHLAPASAEKEKEDDAGGKRKRSRKATPE